ncbi:MAG: hypothetical protein HYX47_08430 [Burkholderiales bacterium]|nr:hypothetical protein [Burkholderiales bacterium]
MFSILERVLRFQRIHGTRRLGGEIWRRVKSRLNPSAQAAPDPLLPDDKGRVGGRELVAKHFEGCTPLRLFTVPAATPARVTLVTNSVHAETLDGKVAASLTFGALAARALGAKLRIVTRFERAQPAVLRAVLEAQAISLSHEIEFGFAPAGDAVYELDCQPGETFVATSWWTAAAVLASVPGERVIYLLQDDERTLYPYGDAHLRCSRVMANSGIRFAVSTKPLFDRLIFSGLQNIAARGIWFEPSQPEAFAERFNRLGALPESG